MKKSRRIILLILITVLAFFAWFKCIAPGKRQFLSSLKKIECHNGEILLESFYQNETIQSAKISKEQFDLWIDALPSKSGGLQITSTKCFIPHHRLRFDTKSPRQEVIICFNCDEFWTETTGRRKIPKAWRQPFRDLFSSAGMPDTAPSSSEYEQYLETMFSKPSENSEAESNE